MTHKQIDDGLRYSFAKFAPLKAILCYLAITYGFAVWGPLDYYQFPIGKTTLFMIGVVTSIIIGFTHATRTGMVLRAPKDEHLKFVNKLFDISLAIASASLIYSILESIFSGQLNTDFAGIGEAYTSGYEGYERNTGSYSITFVLYSISLPFNFISTIWGLFYFKSIGRARQIAVLTLIIATLLFYVLGSGKQKQLGDVLIYAFSIIALKYGCNQKPINKKLVAGVGLISVAALVAFTVILGQRYAALGFSVDNIDRHINRNVAFDTGHWIFSLLGRDWGFSFAIFTSYLSQGYYGLGLALDAKWSWTYFLGSSYSISVIANQVFGLEWLWRDNLVNQVGNTYGWGESKWHTVFTHFATDFTFIGTILLFGWFAYVFARSWLAAIRYQNPFAILMFCWLSLGACFIPANNQLLHSPGSLFTTVAISILYVTIGRRFNSFDLVHRRLG